MGTMYVKAKGFPDPVLINEEDFDEKVHTKLTDKAEAKIASDNEPPDLDSMTKAELLEEAGKRGVDVPAGATKAEILDALTAPE